MVPVSTSVLGALLELELNLFLPYSPPDRGASVTGTTMAIKFDEG